MIRSPLAPDRVALRRVEADKRFDFLSCRLASSVNLDEHIDLVFAELHKITHRYYHADV